MLQKQNRHGFTLIELLVVVLIIGILTAVALPQYTTAVEKSRAAEALTLMSAMVGSIERYRLQKDAWPDANAFTKLDVEIPQASGTTGYGGANFLMSFEPVGSINSTTQYRVIASRRLDASPYLLETTITEATNGTFSIVRKCKKGTASNATDITDSDSSEAAKFCNAITSGKPGGF